MAAMLSWTQCVKLATTNLYLVCISNDRSILWQRAHELLSGSSTAVPEKAHTHSIMSFTTIVKYQKWVITPFRNTNQ